LTKCQNLQPAPIRLAAVTDPNPAAFAPVLEDLRGKGVAFIDSFDKMLADPEIEALWLPLPIPLHRPYTERALAAGKAVMCEKPAAGCVQDVTALIAARDRAGLPAVVGFQDIYEPVTLALKRKLLGGTLGPVRRLSLHGCWPRGDKYFNRAAWAGGFKRDGVWVMDSPANNAMSHYLNMAMFLAGPELDHSAQPLEVEAELYRANPIENYDTCSLRVVLETAGGRSVELVALLTHSCFTQIDPTLVIYGERGTLHWTSYGHEASIQRPGKPPEVFDRQDEHEDHQVHSVERFARLVRGVPDSRRAVASLEDSYKQLTVIGGASEATDIVNVPRDAVEVKTTDRGLTQCIRGIEEAFARCAASGKMLHESGLMPWTAAGGRRDVRDYRQFAGPKSYNGAEGARA
jgi:predicted dehydrogenase